VDLVFRKPNASNLRTIKGIVKLEDGTTIDAYLWAWSESGASKQVVSDTKGVFALELARDMKWHIGGGKIYNGTSYKSSDLVINDSSPDTIELTLNKFGETAPPAQITQAANQQIFVQVQDGAKVTIPENAAPSTGSVNLSITPTVEVASQAGAKVVSNAYDVTLTDASGTAVTKLQKQIEIVLPYNKDDLKKQGVTEDSIIPSYFDDLAQTWKPCESYVIDKAHSQAVCRVSHLTRFAIVAAADISPPPPPTQVNVVKTKDGLLISWVNPVRDLDHIKIYRSKDKASPGTVIFPDVSGTSQLDTTVENGTYYYLVRSVSPAGNESTNANSVAATYLNSVANSGSWKRNLTVGMRGSDIVLLQQILTREGVYRGAITGYFGPMTKIAVVKFQEKYASEILVPNGLIKGTGTVKTSTRAKLNALVRVTSVQ